MVSAWLPPFLVVLVIMSSPSIVDGGAVDWHKIETFQSLRETPTEISFESNTSARRTPRIPGLRTEEAAEFVSPLRYEKLVAQLTWLGITRGVANEQRWSWMGSPDERSGGARESLRVWDGGREMVLDRQEELLAIYDRSPAADAASPKMPAYYYFLGILGGDCAPVTELAAGASDVRLAGEERVAGVTCEKYTFVAPGGKYVLWISRDGFTPSRPTLRAASVVREAHDLYLGSPVNSTTRVTATGGPAPVVLQRETRLEYPEIDTAENGRRIPRKVRIVSKSRMKDEPEESSDTNIVVTAWKRVTDTGQIAEAIHSIPPGTPTHIDGQRDGVPRVWLAEAAEIADQPGMASRIQAAVAIHRQQMSASAEGSASSAAGDRATWWLGGMAVGGAAVIVIAFRLQARRSSFQ